MSMSSIQYIPRNMHAVFALLCFVVVIHWLIFPYPTGLFHWHCGNLTIAPVPAKQPWWIWINTPCEFIMNDCITTTKQSTTKPCAYFLGYTVPVATRYLVGLSQSGKHDTVGSHENSTPRNWLLTLSNALEIWLAPRQRCCQDTFQISLVLDNFIPMSGGFEWIVVFCHCVLFRAITSWKALSVNGRWPLTRILMHKNGIPWAKHIMKLSYRQFHAIKQQHKSLARFKTVDTKLIAICWCFWFGRLWQWC